MAFFKWSIWENLINKLAQENFVNNDDGFQRFYGISSATLYKHAPCKKKKKKKSSR